MSSLFYYEPFFSFNDFDRLVDRAFGGYPSSRQITGGADEGQTQQQLRGFTPKMDVVENAETNQVTATFELPGLKKEDVSISIENNRLVIAGESSASNESDKDGWVVKERRWGKFSRSVPLPTGTQPDQIKAGMENGVLTITYPKTSPNEVPKKITIS